MYVGINALNPSARSRTKEDIAAIRQVYLDFGHNGTATVQCMIKSDDLPKPNYLVNFSPRKWQTAWKAGRSRTPSASTCSNWEPENIAT